MKVRWKLFAAFACFFVASLGVFEIDTVSFHTACALRFLAVNFFRHIFFGLWLIYFLFGIWTSRVFVSWVLLLMMGCLRYFEYLHLSSVCGRPSWGWLSKHFHISSPFIVGLYELKPVEAGIMWYALQLMQKYVSAGATIVIWLGRWMFLSCYEGLASYSCRRAGSFYS